MCPLTGKSTSTHSGQLKVNSPPPYSHSIIIAIYIEDASNAEIMAATLNDDDDETGGECIVLYVTAAYILITRYHSC